MPDWQGCASAGDRQLWALPVVRVLDARHGDGILLCDNKEWLVMEMVTWFDQPDQFANKPSQYYYRGCPCKVIAVGFPKEADFPSVLRVEMESCETHEVWHKDGEFPGLVFEDLSLAAGHA